MNNDVHVKLAGAVISAEPVESPGKANLSIFCGGNLHIKDHVVRRLNERYPHSILFIEDGDHWQGQSILANEECSILVCLVFKGLRDQRVLPGRPESSRQPQFRPR
jgi:hypothetical protein